MRMGKITTAGDIVLDNPRSTIKLGRGSSEQRPVLSEEGMIRFNTEKGQTEQFANGAWDSLHGGSANGRNVGNLGFAKDVFYGSPVSDYLPVSDNYFVERRLYAAPFFVSSEFNRVGFKVTNRWGSPQGRLAIYENIDGAPGNLLDLVGTVTLTSTGAKEIIYQNSVSKIGTWVWLAMIISTAMNLACYGYSNSGGAIMGRSNVNDYSPTLGVTGTTTSFTTPSSFPTDFEFTANIFPYLWVRRV